MSTSPAQRERRDRMLEAAMKLAAEGGYDAVQMREVADGAGVALGTLYRYFPSKMDLVVAVVAEELDLLEASIERRPPRAASRPQRVVDVLMRATRGLIREPELADALIRSLLLSDIKIEFGDRTTNLLLRAAYGPEEPIPADDERRVVAKALTSIWAMEMIEILRGHSTLDETQGCLEIAASRLLGDD